MYNRSMKKERTITREILLLFLGYAINFFGSGMTMPFLMVYLNQVRHISLASSGIVLGASSIAGILAAPLMGLAVDRFGALKVLISSVLVLAVGTAGYSLATNVWSALIVSAFVGAGNAAMWNGLSTRLAHLSARADRAKVFGLSYAVQNLGLGLGSGISGFMVHTNDPLSFVHLFLFDALTYVLFIPFLVSFRKVGDKKVSDKDMEAVSTADGDSFVPADSGYGNVLNDGALLLVAGLNLVFVVFGFSQLSSSFSTWAIGSAHVGTNIVGFAFFANCIGITLFQVPVLRLTASWHRTRAASVAGLGFFVCWVMVFAAGKMHGLVTSGLLVGALVVFGLGETFLSPSLVPLVNNLANDSVRGRYNAVYNLSWQVGLIVGPLVAGFALGQGTGSSLFLVLAVLCGLGGVCAGYLGRIIPEAANRGSTS
jgi:MFS family permease